MSDSKVKEAEEALGHTTRPEPEPADQDYLSTGVTLVNLATYGRIDGGLLKGKIYRLSGRSSSGKTFLGRTILAEAASNPSFDGYELVYDDVERGALMDTEKFFGRRLLDRLVPPARDKNREPLYSTQISEFYNRLQRRLDAGKRVVWVEDSLDSLRPDDGAETRMSDGKAKTNSQRLRELVDPLAATGSILVIVSQVRDNMNLPPIPSMRASMPQDVISGGRAPEFYSTLDIILSKKAAIKAAYKDTDYVIGHHVGVRIRKNRLSGVDHMITFPFYRDYGIDDVGANVDFLVHVKHWNKDKGGTILADELDVVTTRTKLIRQIEEGNLQQQLREVVGVVWKEIQDAISPKRKPRYD